jgi:hypothetical protein
MRDSNCSGFVGIVQGTSSLFSFIHQTMQIYVLITISSTWYNDEFLLRIAQHCNSWRRIRLQSSALSLLF